jgi:hypothetical protein
MRRLWRFLAGNPLVAVAVSFLVNAMTAQAATPVRMAVLAGTFVFLAVLAFSVRELLNRRRRQVGIAAVAQAAVTPRRGLVLTLNEASHERDSAADLALRVVRPEYLGLFGTKETDAAMVSDRVVSERCAAAGIVLQGSNSKRWDLGDLRDGVRTVETLIDWMTDRGLTADDIVVDVTAGLVPMSVAAFLAAQSRGVVCEYIQSDYDTTGRRQPGSERFVLITQGQLA